jgi:hypothetical protein
LQPITSVAPSRMTFYLTQKRCSLTAFEHANKYDAPLSN